MVTGFLLGFPKPIPPLDVLQPCRWNGSKPYPSLGSRFATVGMVKLCLLKLLETVVRIVCLPHLDAPKRCWGHTAYSAKHAEWLSGGSTPNTPTLRASCLEEKTGEVDVHLERIQEDDVHRDRDKRWFFLEILRAPGQKT